MLDFNFRGPHFITSTQIFDLNIYIYIFILSGSQSFVRSAQSEGTWHPCGLKVWLDLATNLEVTAGELAVHFRLPIFFIKLHFALSLLKQVALSLSPFHDSLSTSWRPGFAL